VYVHFYHDHIRLVLTRVDGTLANCRREAKSLSHWHVPIRGSDISLLASTDEVKATDMPMLNGSRHTWLDADEAKVILFVINIFSYSVAAMAMSWPSFNNIRPHLLLLHHTSHMADDEQLNIWWKSANYAILYKSYLSFRVQTVRYGQITMDTNTYSYNISWIQIQIWIVSTMSDKIWIDIDIINIWFEYLDTYTVSDVIFELGYERLNSSKRI
jgi:hypothetical protein